MSIRRLRPIVNLERDWADNRHPTGGKALKHRGPLGLRRHLRTYTTVLLPNTLRASSRHARGAHREPASGARCGGHDHFRLRLPAAVVIIARPLFRITFRTLCAVTTAR